MSLESSGFRSSNIAWNIGRLDDSVWRRVPPRQVFAPPKKPAWDQLRELSVHSGCAIQIDIAAPNPVVPVPDELFPAARNPFLANLPVSPRVAAVFDRDKPRWWRKAITQVCADAGLTFQADGKLFMVSRARGLRVSPCIAPGLREGRYDVDWRGSTVRQACEELQALFPGWRFEIDWVGADETSAGFRRFSPGIDLEPWQVAYLLGWCAGFEVEETADGMVFRGSDEPRQAHSGIQASGRIAWDHDTGEIVRPRR